MKCESCNIVVGSEFSFAIKSNQCPACGKSIMQTARLASYLSLKTLLENNFPNIDIERVTNLIVANFELKQAFKENSVEPAASKAPVVKNEQSEAEEAGPRVAVDSDGIKYEKLDDLNRNKLKKMRDEALKDALSSAEEIDFSEEVLLSEDPIANAELLKQRDKQIKASNSLSSGQGMFRR
jgi:hypothetical protein